MSQKKKPGRPAATIDQPAAPAVVPEGVNQCLAEHAEATAIEQAVVQRELEISDTLMSIGVHRAMQASAVLHGRAAIEAYDRIVSAGKHLGLAYRKPGGDVATTQNVEEFCTVFLGRSYKSLAEQRQNLRLVGPELYDQLEAVGLQRSDWRALRGADDALQAALAAPDEQRLDRVLAVVESLQARQEKSEVEIADLKADAAAKDKLAQARAKKLDELETALERRAALPQVEQENLLIAEVDEAVQTACAGAGPLIGKLIAAQQGKWSERVNATCRHAIERCLAFYLDVARDHDVGIDLAAMLDGAIGGDVPSAVKEPALTAVK